MSEEPLLFAASTITNQLTNQPTALSWTNQLTNCFWPQIGLVSQEPLLFAGTVLDNIKWVGILPCCEQTRTCAHVSIAHARVCARLHEFQ